MATMKEIAELADVSVSTVSKALRNASDVGGETRKQIKKIAADLGYTYRASSRPPRYTKTPNVGIVCPEVTSHYYSQMLTSMEDTLSKEGYATLVSISRFRPEVETRLLRSYIELGLDGIICITESRTIQATLESLFADRYMPFILVTNQLAVHEFDYIDIDDEHAVRIAVEHLKSLGHSRIGYIGDHVSRGRKNLYLKHLHADNLQIDDDHVVENDKRFEECGYVGMQSILSLRSWPTAVFCAYDAIAIGALRAAYEHGLAIPKELSVIAIDDVSEASFLYRSLTTVSGPSSRLGKIAVDNLIDQIESEKTHVVQHVTLKPHLVVRETTSSPRNNAVSRPKHDRAT